MNEQDIIEKLAEIEHEQWMLWAKNVQDEVSEERKKRWQNYFVEYKNLPEKVKNKDRIFARKVLDIINLVK